MNENRVSKLHKINKVLWVIILITVAFNIIFLMRYNFEADSAYFVTLAQEQIRSKSLIPEGVFYSTGVFILTPNLLVIPFLFLTSNLVLARQLAILLLWIFVYFVLFKLFVTKQEKNMTGFIIASSLFSVFYVNASVVSMHFYQGAYITYLLYLLLFLALMKRIILEYNIRNKCLSGLIILFVLANLGDIRNLLIWGIPGLAAYVLYLVLGTDGNLGILKKRVEDIKVVRVLFNGVLIGFIVSVVMMKVCNYGGVIVPIIGSDQYGESFSAIITGLFNLFGNSYHSSLFSVAGIFKFINFFVVLIFFLYIPIFAVKNYHKIASESEKFVILFVLISTCLYLLIAFLTGFITVQDRYLIPIYNNGIILFAIVVSFILEKYFNKFVSIGIVLVLLYVLFSNIFYFFCQKESLLNQKYGYFAEGIEGVTDFLTSKELEYGYATFFNAEEYTILSNDKVKIRSIRFIDGKIMPNNWLTFKRFYEPDIYKGNTFLMITQDEVKEFLEFFPNGFSQLELGQPKEILTFNKYLIFVFDYNISIKFKKERN